MTSDPTVIDKEESKGPVMTKAGLVDEVARNVRANGYLRQSYVNAQSSELFWRGITQRRLEAKGSNFKLE